MLMHVYELNSKALTTLFQFPTMNLFVIAHVKMETIVFYSPGASFINRT